MLKEVVIALSQVWQLFEEVQVPGLSISFAQLWLGAFVVMVSIIILRPLLGIGAAGASNIFSGLRSARKSGYDRSYKKYAKDRSRRESFEKRYKEEHK